MKKHLKQIIFLLFFISGFCGLLYQVVWMRLAYSSFGVITPVLSVVISVFMTGLSLGSWLGGKYILTLIKKTKLSAIFFYAIAEIFIGMGAFAVPKLFSFGETFLLTLGNSNSFAYLFISALIIAATLFPWCFFMGSTVPIIMAFFNENNLEKKTSFSFLYIANVLGGFCGTVFTALVFIELFGFSKTLLIAAILNFLIATISIIIFKKYSKIHSNHKEYIETPIDSTNVLIPKIKLSNFKAIVFYTGFSSMSMEVIWTRAFTPILQTRTYSFSAILAIYLLSTWLGSLLYRDHLKKNIDISIGKILGYLSIFALLPIVMNDPRLDISFGSTLFSIIPFCTGLGYLTPKIIDQYSSGLPIKAGKIYAINIVGCIIGPLFASYFLLPLIGVKYSLIILSLPYFIFFLINYKKNLFHDENSIITIIILFFILSRSIFVNISTEEMLTPYAECEIRRDHTATVIAATQGNNKYLYVNGIGITSLYDSITKIMGHLPLFFSNNKSHSGLVICLGMGTTYRSLLSWGLKVKAVELIPSVKDSLGYFFKDIVNHPNGQIIIDDGRRFLKRSLDKFDIITIDPPPPIEAASSSLLYSEEFYECIKLRLNNDGIFQQWFPGGEHVILQAVTRSLVNTFPYVKIFKATTKGSWGYHFIASLQPLKKINVNNLINMMPKTAKKDLLEWYSTKDASKIITHILSKEIPLSSILNKDKSIVIKDDTPFNEYYLIRRTLQKIRKLHN